MSKALNKIICKTTKKNQSIVNLNKVILIKDLNEDVFYYIKEFCGLPMSSLGQYLTNEGLKN